MPSHPPDDITDAREQTLWRDLSRTYEEFTRVGSGSSFIKVAERVLGMLRGDKTIRTYAVSQDGELITTVGSMDECLEVVHESLGEMMTDVNRTLKVTVEVGPGNADDL